MNPSGRGATPGSRAVDPKLGRGRAQPINRLYRIYSDRTVTVKRISIDLIGLVVQALDHNVGRLNQSRDRLALF